MNGILIDVYINNEPTRMDIEDVLFYEMQDLDIFDYHIEVVKALAILMRSEISKRIKNSTYYTSSTKEIFLSEENLKKLDGEKKRLLKMALEETEGVIVVSGDKSVDVFLTRCCGGGTANSEDILGYRVSYLRKVLCKYCSEDYSEKIVKINDIAKKININRFSYRENIDDILKNVVRDETGRILKVNFLGKEMSGEEFIKYFGVASNRVYFLEDSISLKTVGEGLGLGVCLKGANNLAKNGAIYKDIINYYYTGIEFKRLDGEGISKLLSGKKIIIDPGHGGRDKGSVNKDVIEKDVNLSIALSLEKMLRRIGANVILTRNEDIDISLEERVKFINAQRPEFCISIHQNSFMMPGINGVEAYCYDKDNEAIKLGKFLCSNISDTIGVKNRGVRTGDYYILRESRVSTLILECMYLTGNIDISKYSSRNYLLIAGCIFDSICKYYNVEPQN